MRQTEAFVPTIYGTFNMIAYANDANEPMPHLALVHENFDPSQPTTLRIHSECMTGDVFASKKCDCGEQLSASLKIIAEQQGVLLYLRQEGRGIGLINKLKAYKLQEQGYNTIEANLHLGFLDDERQYEDAIAIINDLGISKIRLITNNPLKIEALKAEQLDVIERIPIIINPKKENEEYLEVKKTMMGHLF